MSYVIIRVREGSPRDFVPDRSGKTLVFERLRTAQAYVDTVLDRTVAEYRIYKTNRLPEYMGARMQEVA